MEQAPANLKMHPLDKLCAEPVVAATFEWLEPERDDGSLRKWRIRVPRELFERYRDSVRTGAGPLHKSDLQDEG